MEKQDITPAKIKAARALLEWDGQRLAAASGVSLPTLRRFESRAAKTGTLAIDALVRTLEAAGVEFIPGGVRLKSEAAGHG